MGISIQPNLKALKADIENSITTAKDSIETVISGAVDTIEGSAEARKTVLQLAIADVVTGGEGSAQIIIDALNNVAADLSGEIAAKSAIKSIQTGAVTEFGPSNYQVDIVIAPVNTSKSMVIVQSSTPLDTARTDNRYSSRSALANSTTLSLTGFTGVSIVSWQVIEYE